jgi:hypothetical protein
VALAGGNALPSQRSPTKIARRRRNFLRNFDSFKENVFHTQQELEPRKNL